MSYRGFELDPRYLDESRELYNSLAQLATREREALSASDRRERRRLRELRRSATRRQFQR
jgi:hypothetical protein